MLRLRGASDDEWASVDPLIQTIGILETQPHLIGRGDPEPRDKADRYGPNQRIDPRRCVCQQLAFIVTTHYRAKIDRSSGSGHPADRVCPALDERVTSGWE